MKRSKFLTLALISFSLFVTLLLRSQTLSAHGGFVIDSGEIDNYEWAVSIFPYPVQVGASVLSILLFDRTTGAPASDLSGEVYLAEPGDTRPCCEPGVQRGPFPVSSDQTLYPGDYTTFIPVDAPGRWQILFKMKSATGEYGIVTGFDAIPIGDGSQPVDKPAIATQVALAYSAASAASAGRSANAQVNSPLAQPNSPLVAAQAQPLSPSPLDMPVTATTAQPSIGTVDEIAAGDNRTFLLAGGLVLIVVLGAAAMLFMGKSK